MKNYEFDKVDLKLISILQEDARTPFLEIARRLNVSGGTIHVTVFSVNSGNFSINLYNTSRNL